MSAPDVAAPRHAAPTVQAQGVASASATALQQAGRADASAKAASDAKPERQDGSSEQPAVKRKRPQSCDTCRSRKIKCVRLQVEGLEPGADQRCVQCRAIEAKCTFDYIPKRPGPQSSFARTAKREQQALAQAQAQARAAAALGQSRGKAVPAKLLPSPSTDVPPFSAGGNINNNGLNSNGNGGGNDHDGGGISSYSAAQIADGFDEAWYKAFSQSLQGPVPPPPAFGSHVRASPLSSGSHDFFATGRHALDMSLSPFGSVAPALNSAGDLTGSGSMAGQQSSASSGDVQMAQLDRRWSDLSGFDGAAAASSASAPSRGAAGGAAELVQLYAQQHSQSHAQPQHHLQQQPSQQQQPQRAADIGMFLQPSGAAAAASSQVKSVPLQVPLPPDSRGQSPNSAAMASSVLPLQSPASYSESAASGPLRPRSYSGKRKARGHSSLSKVYAGPVMRPRSLDDIAPRQTFLSVLALYFHYLWPLMPIVDRPSFSLDLITRRDARDETFLAFVLSLTAYTLIQCPRTVIPAPWSLFRKLHRICHRTSRRMQPRRYDPPQLLHVATLYCDHIYLGTVGQNNAANAALGEAVRVAYTLGIHDERRLDPHSARNAFGFGLGGGGGGGGGPGGGGSVPRRPVNAVERELRKRLFWLLHGSSTTIAVLQDEPMFIRDIDTCVDLPLAVDEETLTSPHLEQRGPSLLCGFVTVSRLHQLLSELLEMYRRDRRFPPNDLPTAKSRLGYIANILKRVRKTLADMPEQLRKPQFTHQPPPSSRPAGVGLPDVGSRLTMLGGGPFDQQQQQQHSQQKQQHQLQQQQRMPLQAIGMSRPLSPSLFGGKSASSVHNGSEPAWPWPADAFDKDGLPNAEATSNNSSANHSPRAQSVQSVPTSGPGSLSEGYPGMSAAASVVASSQWQQPGGIGGGGYNGPVTTSSEQWNPFEELYGNAPGAASKTGFSTPSMAMDIEPRPESETDPAVTAMAMDQVNAFRPSPPPQPEREREREPILSPLCTLHANVIVTEAMVRFVMVEYRELIGARVADLRARGQVDFDGGLGGGNRPGEAGAFGYNESEDGWEAAAKDMLDVLHGMPLEALASNGQSMTSKIIYVVSSLLNRTATNTRGYSYMTSFLQMLTRLSQDRGPNEEEHNEDLESSDDDDGDDVAMPYFHAEPGGSEPKRAATGGGIGSDAGASELQQPGQHGPGQQQQQLQPPPASNLAPSAMGPTSPSKAMANASSGSVTHPGASESQSQSQRAAAAGGGRHRAPSSTSCSARPLMPPRSASASAAGGPAMAVAQTPNDC
ncbi:uncharacterized protein PFL1_05313 [Pseudozyma flocculosa PF-1]|uniref:Zn(2)-C6 fungal-type domain-containing protein n=2 Tax=Pseudozyma flocculosa TaxID=84751 RepID=A0A5C3FE98_9BASI|nr:uncharacterized protein PFL1_05313 [Pseudozyma flocculosa PF-1]EPQ27029.1 hypothetical protein PFL1_05313 [Pseudozyma flocculosa PF-1]SPO42025.1 uncharacterized protein PSFLO_07508 [Pseudozyma flocculosa]